MSQNIALFGEAEKGEFASLIFIKSLTELNATLGHPPIESRGLYFAIQFLLYEYKLIYIRVKEEGFSVKDYLKGIKLLSNKKQVSQITAMCLPGVGDAHILDATTSACTLHQAFFIMTEKDLYDYLTSLHH